jgi:hypothetical protein
MHHTNRVRFIKPDKIEEALRPYIPADEDRQFIVRCLLREGPEHHRGANYILLSLLGLLAAESPPSATEGVPVPMRLPPHLAQNEEASYPIQLPLRVLDRLAPRGSAEQAEMLGCVTDGPPQHALANVAMLCLLDTLLAGRDK